MTHDMTMGVAAAMPLQDGHLPLTGISALVRLVYEQGDIKTAWDALVARLTADAGDTSALMDISVLLQTTGQRDKGLQAQAAAIAQRKVYRRIHGTGEGLRIVAFVTAGDMMANTPIDFLLEGSNVTLHFVYLDATMKLLPPLPACDAAFMAIGESEANQPVLENVARLLRHWMGPKLLNANALRIAGLTRHGVNDLLDGEPIIFSPRNLRAERDALDELAAGTRALDILLPGAEFPLIIRPFGTHAGHGMEKLETRESLATYLAAHPEGPYYIAPFVDYAGPDGLFRKQRIVFIEGRAFASHLAVSEHWMVHYLSANMVEDAARRAEEAAWMESFDTDFAVRHAAAFAALTRRFGLNYFGIDCAEMPDGRLLVFEADVAMIVHDMDPEDVFPYKKPAMRKLFAAFHAALAA